MKATYEQLDTLCPEDNFITFQPPRGLFWVILIRRMMLMWGIEPVFGRWN